MLKQPLPTGEFGNTTTEVPVELELKGNPFPGLRPFSLDECHLFFGREGQADEILVKLANHRFVTVLGYSGSGKSSLMSCGLIPVLLGGFMTQTGPNWTAIISRPGNSPIRNLAKSVVEHLIECGRVSITDKDIHSAIIESVLRSGPQGLVEVSRYVQNHSAENVFFLIDQFEELFRFRQHGEADAHNESHLYVNLIMNAVSQKTVPVYSAITMRSDFIGSCAVFSNLTDLINKSNYLVPQMTREQRKMVIEGPISVGGGRISQRLLKKLLSDVGNNQDQLPILQHVLMRTWDHWIENREPGEPIDLRHYNAVGRIHEALSLHANEAYDELSTRQKEIAEVLFKSITEKSQDNKGMRRTARLDLIAELAEAEEEDVMYVVEHFRKPGRSLLMPAANVPLQNDSLIELSHESLMRIWKRLDIWVEEEFESAQMYKRLSEAAAMYQIGKTGLWRPPDLQLALNWQKKQRPTREWAQRYDETFERAIVFLDTSRITYEAELKNQEMMQRRVLRRARVTAVVLGAAFVIAIVFFVLAYIQKLTADGQKLLADEQRLEAEKQSELARKSEIRAQEQADLASQRSTQLASTNEQLQGALKDARRERQRAQEALAVAEEERQKAVLAGESEKKSREVAEVKTVEAQTQANRANRLLFLALAQSLATKSIQVDDNPSLAALLAMQAYHYHTFNEGAKYDPFIYEGLYSALTKLNSLSYNAIRAPGPRYVHIKSVEVSPTSSNFYTAGVDGRILLGNHENLITRSTNFSTPYPSKAIAVSRDENFLVNGSDSSFVQIYDLRSPNNKPLVARDLQGSTNDLEFLPDGSGVIVASADKSLSFLNHRTGSIKRLAYFPFEIKSFSIRKDGKKIVAGAWTGEVAVIDLSDYSVEMISTDPATRALSVKYSNDSNLIAMGIDDKENKRGLVKIYNISTKQITQFTGHRAGVNDVEFSPDGKLLASAGSDKRLLLWLLDNPGALPITMANNNGFIWDIAFTHGSQFLVAACSESEIRVWPTDPQLMADQICPQLDRNMTEDEWKKYVGEGENIKYERTCIKDRLTND